MHLILRVRTIQNRPSTQILVEVEVVAAEAKVVADLGRIRDKISLMFHNWHTQVVKASLKARGAKEDVAEVPDRILVIAAVTLNVIIVVKGDISLENVQRTRLMKIEIGKGSRITMHLLADKIDEKSEHLFVMQHMMNTVECRCIHKG